MLYYTRDSMKDKKLIELYVKYVDKKEKYKLDFNQEFDTLINQIENTLTNAELRDLIDLYIEYTNFYNLNKCQELVGISDMIYNFIVSKLNTVSVMKLIDLYTVIYNVTLRANELVCDDENRLLSRQITLENEFDLNQVIKSQTRYSREEFITNYRKENFIFEKNLVIDKESYELLDKLQDAFLVHIDTRLNKTTKEEEEQLLATINKRIEEKSNEKIRRNRILANRKQQIKLYGSLQDKNSHQVYENLSTSELKNSIDVYINYKNNLLRLLNNKNIKNSL